MSVKTKIQWCDSTCNPTMGCEGCELWNAKTGVKTCYAGVLHKRFGGRSKGYSPRFEELTLHPGRMAKAARWKDLTGTERKEKPWLNGLPRLVFVSDMSDALSRAVSFQYLEEAIIGPVTSDAGRRHRWLWLTKRPERMAEFSKVLEARGIEWPENLWIGTSITSPATTSRIKSLLRVGNEQTVRFLSVEPQHEAIDLRTWLPRLDWVIQGGESGGRCRPFQIEWAVEMVRQCKDHGVAYFLKQLGSNVHHKGRLQDFSDGHAGDWAEWPKHLRIRQMPKAAVAIAKPTPPMRIPLDVIRPETKERRSAPQAKASRRRK
jgi:protein gp37